MAFVYVISNGKLYKIGIATNVRSRLSGLQTGSTTDLSVVRQFEVGNAIALEAELHALMREKRVRGEWFDLTDNDLNRIDEYVRGWKDGTNRPAPLLKSQSKVKDLPRRPEKYSGERLRKSDWVGKYGSSGRPLLRLSPGNHPAPDVQSAIGNRPVRIWWEVENGRPQRCVEFLDEPLSADKE